MVKSISILIAFFLLASCSITKRVHKPGWHVEWKSSNQKVAEKNIETNPILSGGQREDEEQSRLYPETNNLRYEPTVTEMPQQTMMVQNVEGDEVNSEDNVLLRKQAQSKLQVLKRQSIAINEDEKVADKRLEPFGMLSLASFLMALTSIFLGISFGWSLMALSYIVFFIFGIVSAIISLRRFRNSPDVYRGKRFIKIGLIAFLSVYGVMILLSIVLLIWYIFTGSGITFM